MVQVWGGADYHLSVGTCQIQNQRQRLSKIHFNTCPFWSVHLNPKRVFENVHMLGQISNISLFFLHD